MCLSLKLEFSNQHVQPLWLARGISFSPSALWLAEGLASPLTLSFIFLQITSTSLSNTCFTLTLSLALASKNWKPGESGKRSNDLQQFFSNVGSCALDVINVCTDRALWPLFGHPQLGPASPLLNPAYSLPARPERCPTSKSWFELPWEAATKHFHNCSAVRHEKNTHSTGEIVYRNISYITRFGQCLLQFLHVIFFIKSSKSILCKNF